VTSRDLAQDFGRGECGRSVGRSVEELSGHIDDVARDATEVQAVVRAPPPTPALALGLFERRPV
jgi:hypothetical protein